MCLHQQKQIMDFQNGKKWMDVIKRNKKLAFFKNKLNALDHVFDFMTALASKANAEISIETDSSWAAFLEDKEIRCNLKKDSKVTNELDLIFNLMTKLEIRFKHQIQKDDESDDESDNMK